jgi:hypothetical protein
MASIVEELQTLAYDSAVPIADLLRRVKVAATKLGLSGTVAWVDSELNGYGGNVPDYRRVPQRLVYFNMVHGWQPVMFDNDKMSEIFSGTRPIASSIREIEELARQQDAFLYLTLPPGIQAQLFQWGIEAEARSQFSRTALTGILDVVRTRILDWALELDQSGIHGQGVSFSPQEKDLARQHTATINFYGSVGNIAGAVGTSAGPVSVNATQRSTATVSETDARKLAVLLREGASTASNGDETLLNQVADDLDDAAESQPPDPGRLHQALRLARTLVPRLLSWGGRVAAEAEIQRLLGAG